jgi:lipopolysaccharide/colanic/teichoic acid biosynthesis glycosyltransferase
LISPFFLALCLLVYLEWRGHVLHKDQRMGRGGKPFSCIKFRTMVPDAEALLQTDAQGKRRDEGGILKIARAAPRSRATCAGCFLRKTSLNELPQIWNVLSGEMNLIGPRPYPPRESGDIGPHRTRSCAYHRG